MKLDFGAWVAVVLVVLRRAAACCPMCELALDRQLLGTKSTWPLAMGPKLLLLLLQARMQRGRKRKKSTRPCPRPPHPRSLLPCPLTLSSDTIHHHPRFRFLAESRAERLIVGYCVLLHYFGVRAKPGRRCPPAATELQVCRVRRLAHYWLLDPSAVCLSHSSQLISDSSLIALLHACPPPRPKLPPRQPAWSSLHRHRLFITTARV